MIGPRGKEIKPSCLLWTITWAVGCYRLQSPPMLDCTYRVQIPHKGGQLARVASAIAEGEGLIGDVVTLSVGHEHSVREITVVLRDEEQADSIANTNVEVAGVRGIL